MKIAIVLAAFLSATSSAPVDQICAAGEYGNKVHVDCNKFYTCNYGVPILQACPPGLFFNGELSSCDYPKSVEDCSLSGVRMMHGILPTNPEPENEEPSVEVPAPEVPVPEKPIVPEVPTGQCPNKAYFYLINPSNSNTFFICQNGKSSGTGKCGKGLVFSQASQACL